MIKLRETQWIALGAYALIALACLAAAAFTWPVVDEASRPLLAPLLAAIVLGARPQPRDRWLVVTGLALAAAADVMLIWHSATAHVTGLILILGTWLAYIAAFVRGGAIDGLRAMPIIAIAYTLVFVVVVAWLWNDLGDWRFAVLGYGFVLTVAAECAATFGPVIGVGGGLLLVSGALSAVHMAHGRPAGTVLATLTYIAGTALVALGWTRVQVLELASEAPAEAAKRAHATA